MGAITDLPWAEDLEEDEEYSNNLPAAGSLNPEGLYDTEELGSM